MPRDTLTRPLIVGAAIELLDVEGLTGLTMRRLGGKLGAVPTAVYWHVGGRDELIALAADEVWAEVGLPGPAEHGWRPAATTMATDLYSMITRHPWLVPAMSNHLLYGPGKARHDDHLLAVYEAAGLTSDGADEASTTVFAFVLGLAVGATAETAWRARLRRADDGDQRLAEAMAQVSEIARQFPRLRSRAAPEAAAHHDDRLTAGLARILDGIEAESRASGPRP
ncbi:TetR/AcrR family transcriptional regulator C-terminal domain-containing protein [Microlunatus sp. GCM10028923]|uniref:TetR/AcrR family transcriptional regulator C-terminal domain-containing protein n=1 Tax=Microlunatus sp. GCM10028923 TaxID=3273400 RepID=UPI00360C21A1